jgi:hypothetical protein
MQTAMARRSVAESTAVPVTTSPMLEPTKSNAGLEVGGHVGRLLAVRSFGIAGKAAAPLERAQEVPWRVAFLAMHHGLGEVFSVIPFTCTWVSGSEFMISRISALFPASDLQVRRNRQSPSEAMAMNSRPRTALGAHWRGKGLPNKRASSPFVVRRAAREASSAETKTKLGSNMEGSVGKLKTA